MKHQPIAPAVPFDQPANASQDESQPDVLSEMREALKVLGGTLQHLNKAAAKEDASADRVSHAVPR